MTPGGQAARRGGSGDRQLRRWLYVAAGSGATSRLATAKEDSDGDPVEEPRDDRDEQKGGPLEEQEVVRRTSNV
jgi:hypothetical protein